MGRRAVILISAYYLVLALVGAYNLVKLLRVTPSPLPQVDTTETVQVIRYPFSVVIMSDAEQLIAIASLSGLLGALLFSVQSFVEHVGTRVLVWSRVWSYMLMPFVGAGWGLVIILTVQMGLLDSRMAMQAFNRSGVAAVAALAGFVATNASRKLIDILVVFQQGNLGVSIRKGQMS